MEAAVTMHFAASPADLGALASALHGSLVRPSDPEFGDASGIWNLAHQATPMAIVRVADAGDVATAIQFARINGIEIAVRSGGHSMVGHGSGDDALVIDLRGLRGLHIDPAQRIAFAGAGLTAGDVTAAAAAHGLAVPFGDTGSVGIGGITLGGGIGWLVRKHGLTIDALLAVEIVTPDGEVLTASATENEELFWAVRGGGGNFGVVTRFCYRLHPVDQVLAGALVLPLTAEVLGGIVPIAAAAPDELSIIAMVMETPPLPFVPANRHGAMGIMLMFVWAGDPDAGHAAIAPFRELAEPFGEMVAPMPYPAIYEFTAEAATPQASTIRSAFMPDLDDASVEAVVEALAVAPVGSMVQLRVLGGAMGRVPVRGDRVRPARREGDACGDERYRRCRHRRGVARLEPRPVRPAGATCERGLRQLPRERGRRAHQKRLSVGCVRAAGVDQAPIRPAQRPASQPEHSTGCRSKGGAGDGGRTRGLNLGKVALCQLSYSRPESGRR